MRREMPIKLPKEEQSTSHGLLLDLSMDVHLQLSPLIIILTVERTLDPCDLIDPGVCHTNPWCEADHHRKLNKRENSLIYSVHGASPVHRSINLTFVKRLAIKWRSSFPSLNAPSVPRTLCPSNQFEISTPDVTVLEPSVIQEHPFYPFHSSPHWPWLQSAAHMLLSPATFGTHATQEYVSSMASP